MIAYDLKCVNGHSFEGWFENEKNFKDQEKKGLIACPVCDMTAVTRIPSTFAIKSSAKSSPSSGSTAAQMEELSLKITDFIENNFDNVGCDFTKEALKMHYGVTEQRNIRGTSSPEEEKILKEEGIEFIKIPIPTNPESDA
ncbi:MAG: DUF1178 family protein [Desulfobacterales bacterium]|jgi:hypothetical protein